MIALMEEHQSKANNPSAEELEAESDTINPSTGSSNQQEPKVFGHIYLGAPQKLSEIEVVQKSIPQFKLKKLLAFFRAELPLLDVPVPQNLNEQITAQTKVCLNCFNFLISDILSTKLQRFQSRMRCHEFSGEHDIRHSHFGNLRSGALPSRSFAFLPFPCLPALSFLRFY